MEDSVHSNGSRGGGDPRGSGESVGNQTGDSDSTVDPRSRMTWCSTHNCHVKDCARRHTATWRQSHAIDVQRVECMMIRVPCGHLINRPEPLIKKRYRATCGDCEKVWVVVWDGSGTWTAQEVGT